MGTKCVFQYTPIFQTLTFVLFCVWFVWSQRLEYFMKHDWIKSHACLEGKHLFLLPRKVEIVLV